MLKRKLYLFPLMAFTAATFVLAGCDDKKDQEQNAGTETATPADQTAASTMPPVTDSATTAPVSAAVTAEGATAYATTEGTTTGAVFLTLHNTGADADKLVSATSDRSVVEIHENSVGPDGTTQMRKVDSVDVPAGQQVTLKADGYHLMLTSLSAPLAQGETFNVTLTFEKAPAVTVPVTVVAPGAADAGSTSAAAPMDHSGHDMGTMGTTDSAAPVTTSPDAASAPAADETPAPESTTDTTATPSDIPADEQSAE